MMKLFYVSLLTLLLISCEEGMLQPERIPESEMEVRLVSYDSVAYYPEQTIRLGVTVAGFGEFVDYVSNGVAMYRLSYETTFKGRIILASGLVALPYPFEGKTFPILSAHHGTTFAHSRAPSEFSADNYTTDRMELLAGNGFVSFIPDYIGFGDSKGYLHPYYVEEYAASAVIDFIDAGKEFCDELGVNYSDSLFLFGYSEGGYVTMAVQKYIESHPEEGLNVTASAIGSGGYNLDNVMKIIFSEETFSSPNYLGYVMSAYEKTYEFGNDWKHYFCPPYNERIDSLYSGELSHPQINAGLNDTLNVLMPPPFINSLLNGTDQQVYPALLENSVHDFVPSSQTRLYHGTADEIVPYRDSELTYEGFVAGGATTVEFVSIEGGTHGTTLQEMIKNVIPWFMTLR